MTVFRLFCAWRHPYTLPAGEWWQLTTGWVRLGSVSSEIVERIQSAVAAETDR